jgi:hypothetical protein
VPPDEMVDEVLDLLATERGAQWADHRVEACA